MQAVEPPFLQACTIVSYLGLVTHPLLDYDSGSCIEHDQNWGMTYKYQLQAFKYLGSAL